MATTTATGLTIPLAAQVVPGQKFDPVAATNAYLATLPADKRAASNAYFEGGYWIPIWGSVIQIIIVIAVLSFPFTLYTDFFREHQYGLSNLSFGAWVGEQGKALALTIVLGGLAVMALYGVARRFPRTWNI